MLCYLFCLKTRTINTRKTSIFQEQLFGEFEYFGDKVAPKGILFLQETHSSVDTEKQQNDEFKGQLYFSHGKTNSCGVLTRFYGNINFLIKKQLNEKNGMDFGSNN